MTPESGLRVRIEAEVARPIGRLAITLAFSALFIAMMMLLGEAPTFGLPPCLILCALAAFPKKRFLIIGFSPIFWLSAMQVSIAERIGVYRLFRNAGLSPESGSPWLFITLNLTAIGICWAYRAWVEKRASTSLIRRWPLFLFIAAYLAVATLLSAKGIPQVVRLPSWLLLYAVSPFVWYLGYDLEDKPKSGRLKGLERFVLYKPVWMYYFAWPTKGESYLRAVEAKDERELARVQVKGFRLIAWAFFLTLVYIVYNDVVFASNAAPRIPLLAPFCLKIPKIVDALRGVKTGTTYPAYLVWEAVYAEFFVHMLFYTIVGHMIVSVMRMAGFNAFRNTYRPFSARSVAELFGRYNFYFKELLLHVFYYPVYLRFLRHRPRLRLVAATFASVGAGNLLFHYVRDIHGLQENGPVISLQHYLPYALYCLVLSTAISVSLLRQTSRPAPRPVGTLGQLIRISVIVTFFAVLRIFDDTFNGDITRNLALFSQLF